MIATPASYNSDVGEDSFLKMFFDLAGALKRFWAMDELDLYAVWSQLARELSAVCWWNS